MQWGPIPPEPGLQSLLPLLSPGIKRAVALCVQDGTGMRANTSWLVCDRTHMPEPHHSSISNDKSDDYENLWIEIGSGIFVKRIPTKHINEHIKSWKQDEHGLVCSYETSTDRSQESEPLLHFCTNGFFVSRIENNKEVDEGQHVDNDVGKVHDSNIGDLSSFFEQETVVSQQNRGDEESDHENTTKHHWGEENSECRGSESVSQNIYQTESEVKAGFESITPISESIAVQHVCESEEDENSEAINDNPRKSYDVNGTPRGIKRTRSIAIVSGGRKSLRLNRIFRRKKTIDGVAVRSFPSKEIKFVSLIHSDPFLEATMSSALSQESNKQMKETNSYRKFCAIKSEQK